MTSKLSEPRETKREEKPRETEILQQEILHDPELWWIAEKRFRHNADLDLDLV